MHFCFEVMYFECLLRISKEEKAFLKLSWLEGLLCCWEGGGECVGVPGHACRRKGGCSPPRQNSRVKATLLEATEVWFERGPASLFLHSLLNFVCKLFIPVEPSCFKDYKSIGPKGQSAGLEIVIPC